MINIVDSIPRHVMIKCATAVVACVGLIAFSAHASDRRAHDDPNGPTAELVEQAMKWLNMASQDKDPLTRWQHLSYARAYLNVARHLASDAVIESASHVHVRAMSKRIDTELQNAIGNIHKSCHKLRPNVQLSKDDHIVLPGDNTMSTATRTQKELKNVSWMM